MNVLDPLTLLSSLLDLAKRARHVERVVELEFMLVNETYALATYDSATLWILNRGIVAQSGASEVDANASFILWLASVCERLSLNAQPTVVQPEMLGEDDIAQWPEFLPSRALWLPILTHTPHRAGLLLCGELEWTEQQIALLSEWVDTWQYAYTRLNSPTIQGGVVQALGRFKRALPTWQGVGHFFNEVYAGLRYCLVEWLLNPRRWPKMVFSPVLLILKMLQFCLRQGPVGLFLVCKRALLAAWRAPLQRYAWLLIVVAVIPVRLTVLAPGELVPAYPAVIRVPIEGVVEEFFVAPNEMVKEGQALFKLDLTTLSSRLLVAQQEMRVASAEHRQSALQSLTDPKSRGLLGPQESKALERQFEAEYLGALLGKAQIRAPRDGIAIFDDPSTWIGKPVVAGEKVMTVATQGEVEIEGWLSLSDAIELQVDNPVTLYLNASPFSPVSGVLRYVAHEPLQRPDGSFAYRIRATVHESSKTERIGLRGTIRLSGQYVSCAYWVFRKPLAVLRQFVGL